jgi:hypothetical protein
MYDTHQFHFTSSVSLPNMVAVEFRIEFGGLECLILFPDYQRDNFEEIIGFTFYWCSTPGEDLWLQNKRWPPLQKYLA